MAIVVAMTMDMYHSRQQLMGASEGRNLRGYHQCGLFPSLTVNNSTILSSLLKMRLDLTQLVATWLLLTLQLGASLEAECNLQTFWSASGQPSGYYWSWRSG